MEMVFPDESVTDRDAMWVCEQAYVNVQRQCQRECNVLFDKRHSRNFVFLGLFQKFVVPVT